MNLEEKIKDLDERLIALEFSGMFFVSLFFVIIFNFTKEFEIELNWVDLIMRFFLYLGLSFFFFYITIPLSKIIKKVGLGGKKILNQIKEEWKNETILRKAGVIFGLVSFLKLIYSLFI
ncbi:hypothetical protein KKC45_01410 [Patescibacteria group bacterium]|nr:hypothetical protein [Patescibacteria group bacterium]